MAANNSTSEEIEYGYEEVGIPRSIRFWLLLLFDIPAVACTFYLLYYLLFNRTLRKALHNHVIIVLLIVASTSHLIDIPSYIIYLLLGYVWISTPSFCSFWSFVDIGLFNMILILMAWATIERHILVFHSKWIKKRRNRFLFHYVPLILVILYNILFYMIIIFFPSCETIYDYSQPWCGYPCFYDNTILCLYDINANSTIPLILIVIFSITLAIRFIRQKQRVQRIIRWRKHRKMVIQLLLISLVPVIFNSPLVILTIAHYCGLPAEVGAEAQIYLYFLSLLLSYVCLASLPELWKKLNVHIVSQLWAQLQTINIVTPT